PPSPRNADRHRSEYALNCNETLSPFSSQQGCGNDALWKPWKANGGLSTVPTNAWKSQVRRFPHSHSPDCGYSSSKQKSKAKAKFMGTVEKWKSKSRISTFPPSRQPAAQGKNLMRLGFASTRRHGWTSAQNVNAGLLLTRLGSLGRQTRCVIQRDRHLHQMPLSR